jgi:hypothetical protein
MSLDVQQKKSQNLGHENDTKEEELNGNASYHSLFNHQETNWQTLEKETSDVTSRFNRTLEGIYSDLDSGFDQAKPYEGDEFDQYKQVIGKKFQATDYADNDLVYPLNNLRNKINALQKLQKYVLDDSQLGQKFKDAINYGNQICQMTLKLPSNRFTKTEYYNCTKDMSSPCDITPSSSNKL